MFLSVFILFAGFFAVIGAAWDPANSTKRGLVYVATADNANDDDVWIEPGSVLTWYYTYTGKPAPSLANSELEFVPMLWGAPADPTDTAFLNEVKSQIEGGAPIKHVLGFNEPDGRESTGGSNLAPDAAAEVWIRQMEPLRRDHGVRLGLPAVTNAPSGFTWLENFFRACDGKCTGDFLPVHWYGEDFEGFASHLGHVSAVYPDLPIWVTEYAIAHHTLPRTQDFFNASTQYLDRLAVIERYSYFGSFRSSVSNVGPNAAMLTESGKLTDIGALYLGFQVQGNIPHKKNAGARTSPAPFWLLSIMVFLLPLVSLFPVVVRFRGTLL